MKVAEAQRWLALYFLIFTAALGTYILTFPETNLLPIGRDEAQAAFKIIIPVFLGQLTIAFQWYGQATAGSGDQAPSPIPEWAVKGPPIVALCVIVFVIVALLLMNYVKLAAPTANMFSNALTFAVAIINASTVFLVTRLFPQKTDTTNPPQAVPPPLRGGPSR